MSGWEYKVVPAPTKGVKGKGVKGPEARFAHALEAMMNDMGREGWEFQRAETLPSIERSGLTGSTTEWRNLLVFRRTVSDPIDEFEPELLPPPTEALETEASTTDVEAEDEHVDATFAPGEGATQMASDNGVEETSPVSGMTASLKNLASQRGSADAKD
ncbi:DUF4177 domain-containing protein [uncultured Tateyamaria sp.]|uniref:DUF4177 domain-containing protein n=1 Tax=uncultured Tateyamaria sp. TaxID=455651 RepID=UPI00261E7D2D|nr:DUF4177 domain-containing protein [uncultured Tateyamaria sp.]